ncbi:MAG TPA: hypothetical protein VGN18_00575 [Jatrophihabitans sp.]|jgi:hypothetical protein|uniref:hypothetical protein n=1 Tax=Jatrophihabitans sp. TaxID=1932789 RepID=UPI002E06F0BB|nr:hypothetical protein [Jatrophihabitans sp.]
MGGNPVEFLDADPLPDAPPPAPRRPRSRLGDRSTRLAVGLWAAAAVLCVASTVQTIFRYRFAGLAINTSGGYDMWGHPFDKALTSERGPRFALMFWVCGGLCAALGGATAARESTSTPTRWVRAHLHLFGVIAATLVAGAVAGLGLTLQSLVSTYEALAHFLDDGRVYVSIGPGIWLATAALLCAGAAVVVNARMPAAEPVCPPPHSDAAIPA